jgi:hypothetical protein
VGSLQDGVDPTGGGAVGGPTHTAYFYLVGAETETELIRAVALRL